MPIRPLLILLVGLVLAGGSVWSASRWLKAPPAITAQQPAALPATEIVVATADVPFGHAIEAKMLKLQPWPKAALPQGAFTKIEEVVGTAQQERRRARKALAAGEPVVATKVSNFGEKVTIADAINPGKRAMAIKVTDVTGVGGFVTPGDHVDIVLTRHLPNDEMRADTILQRVIVRAIDQVADEDRDKPAVVRTVTLEVGPDEAQKLALAQQAGTLSLTLRNLVSTDEAELKSISLRDLASDEPPPPAPVQRAEGHEPPRPAPVRRNEVTVNRGGIRSQVEVRG
jgi:pilus assembly protein CpaB